MDKPAVYTIISDDSTEALSKKINEMIEQDWQPFGNLAAVYRPSKIPHFSEGVYFYQPMIKYR